ncbi:MAG: aminotransferase class IV [Polyangiaceae bacterium]|nr:aminotransferase class IV [Polyangiaceae bacterium]MCW5791938.1 aminotransferase class IV [Polyangiaceae bacterium]
MTRLVSVNGRIVAPEDAKVSVYDRGFLYGDSVFETLRTYERVPFALTEHLARLERSATLVAMELPVSLEQLQRELLEVLEAAGDQESYARLMITRGQGELGLAPSEAEALRVILVEPLTPPPVAQRERGIAVTLYGARRATDATLAAGAKVGNYLTSVLAMAEARRAGAAEALIVDGEGQVLEGATSNVFVVKDGALITPPISVGILPGITRAAVLALARELGIQARVAPLDVSALLAADEVFITSSIRELLGVVRVADQIIGDGKPGELTHRLHSAFQERVRSGAPFSLSHGE